MKRLAPFVLLAVTLAAVCVPFALAATASAPSAKPVPADKSPAAPIATAISTVTGIAISPLLGTGLYGAYKWVDAGDSTARATLPWYAQPKFWLPALLIVAVCAAKDAFGAMLPPGWKKPLDILETLENKMSGLVAAGAVVPFTMDIFSKAILGKTAAAGAAVAPGGLAMIQFAGIDWSSVLNVLTVPFGVAVFVVVWMASHAINVLILLSPWGAIDAALKAARTALFGAVTLTATIDPVWGAVLSAVVIVISYFLAGWAFRLTIFGSVFCWDFFTRRSRRFVPGENENKMFAGANLPDVPVRTYGRLVRLQGGGLEFVYRPWLFRAPRSAVVATGPASLAVGRGLFFSTLIADDADTLFLLPPRYRGHEETLVRIYAIGRGVRQAGLRKAWGAMKELFGGAAAKMQLA